MTTTPVHIEDLTDDEIVALAEDDLDWMVKRRMAEDGIPILPMPVEPEYLPAPGPDTPLYRVAGVTFSRRDDAEAVMEAINARLNSKVTTDYDYGLSYDIRYVKVDDKPETVTTEHVHSQESFAAHRDVLAANSSTKKQYEADMRVWKDCEGRSQKIRNDIRGRHAEAVAHVAHVENLAIRFREYVRIADGDRFMALQFLLKTVEIDDVDLPKVCGGAVPTPTSGAS